MSDAMMEGFCTLGLPEPLPKSHAELEAEVVLHRYWEPYLFDAFGREDGASIPG